MLQQWASTEPGADAARLPAAQLRPALEALFVELQASSPPISADLRWSPRTSLSCSGHGIPPLTNPPLRPLQVHSGPDATQKAIQYEHIKRLLKRVVKAERGRNPATAHKLPRDPAAQKRSVAEQRTRAVAAALREALSANATRVINLFRQWDEDGSGSVDKREFRAVGPLLAESVGDEVTRAQLDALFDSFDTGRDGSIDYRELNSLLRRGTALPPSLQPGAKGQIATTAENANRLRSKPTTPPHSKEIAGAQLGRLRSQLRGHDEGINAPVPVAKAPNVPNTAPKGMSRLEAHTSSIYKDEVVVGRYKPPAVSLSHLRQQQAALAAVRSHRRANATLGGSVSAPALPGAARDGRGEWAPDPRTHPMSRFFFDMKPMPGMEGMQYEPVLSKSVPNPRSGSSGSPPRRRGGSPPRGSPPPRVPRRSSPPGGPPAARVGWAAA